MIQTLRTTATAAAVALAFGAGAATAADDTPFGGPESQEYAATLWQALTEERLAGDNAIDGVPYRGTEPHGAMLETFFTTMTVDGHTGMVAVKRNYGPAGVEQSAVQGNRAEHLGAVTVMFQREDGYDPDNMNWFWAKYLPDGSLDTNPAGMQLAGRVAKGADQGCIACHSAAPGGDYLYVTDFVR
ncbi:hypothetical protein C882_1875 [Caenispirillum salinarum AK4]|uniref:Cytochrome P460 domain-containing protein n=1 Tax=Caenispirillum salinarum AK4 TaxID=1238182 RepID=K9H9S8_9PROT|nr:cytochrome P460 family protein [Caenispirillum salinarum]EKV27373.1 hypothetical protein C882_1875 [Caenispirillum salinarum AK4]